MYLLPSEWPELRVLVLDIVLEATTPACLPEWPGSSVRGGLLTALRQHACDAHTDHTTCPVCWLIAREDPQWRWGRTPARPYALSVPGGQGRSTGLFLRQSTTEWRRFLPGDTFRFRLTLFGEAVNLFPFLVATLPCMGQNGLGRRLEELDGRRGQFALRSITAVNPLTDETQPLMQPNQPINTPTCFVRTADVLAQATAWEDALALTFFFETPMRLIERRKLCKTPRFRPIFQRALDRLEALMEQYSDRRPRWGDLFTLFTLADQVRTVHQETTWVEMWSGSQRTKRITPLSGFIGQATFVAETWKLFAPLLAWIPVIQVGKDIVKGNGAVRIVVAEPPSA